MTSGPERSLELPALHQAVENARHEAAAAEEGPYRELMATYVALGEALLSGRSDEGLDQDCRDLVGRLLKLGVWTDRMSDQCWALWIARATGSGR